MKKSPEYHVGCGLFGIYAGTLMPNGCVWRNKSDVTDEALASVRDYMVSEFIKGDQTQGGYEWDRKDGKVVKLMISVEDGETKNVEGKIQG